MIAAILAALTLVMKAFPDTPAARALRFWLLELPLERLAKVERRHLIFIGVILFCGQALAVLASVDLAVVAAWDMSTLLDVMIAGWTVAALARGRSAWVVAGRRLASSFRLRRASVPARARQRAPRRAGPRAPANDEGEGPARRAA